MADRYSDDEIEAIVRGDIGVSYGRVVATLRALATETAEIGWQLDATRAELAEWRAQAALHETLARETESHAREVGERCEAWATAAVQLGVRLRALQAQHARGVQP